MTYTYAQSSTRPAHASRHLRLSDVVLVVAVAIIFCPVGLIVLGAV